jgi:hypothetical protein
MKANSTTPVTAYPPQRPDENAPALEYTIVCSDSWLNTKDAVNAKVAEGWEPLGGVSVATYQDKRPQENGPVRFNFAQAMIRRGEATG